MKYAIFAVIAIVLAIGSWALLTQKTNNSAVNGNYNNTPDGNNGGTPAGETTLDLSGKSLKEVPKYVFNQTNLEALNLSGNQLTGAIPAEIRQLSKLKVLNLSNNQMTGVPAEVGQLQNLEILDLSNNQLTGLPYELGNLKNLKILNISGNNYSALDLGIIQKNLPAGAQIIK